MTTAGDEEALTSKVIVYGHGGVDDPDCISPDTFREYISQRIFDRDQSRYRYTQRKEADVIVLAMGGMAYGHFYVDGRVEPTDADLIAYPKVKCVYLVRSSISYEQPVQLSQLGIKGYQFGRPLSTSEFKAIGDSANWVNL